MTITKNTKKAKQLIENAHDVRCFSLSNNFSGTPLPKECHVWGGPHRDLLTVSQQDFLAHELYISHSTKLRQMSDGRYIIYVHSNLWYEFNAQAS